MICDENHDDDRDCDQKIYSRIRRTYMQPGHEKMAKGKEALPEDGALLQETVGRWRYQRMAPVKHAEALHLIVRRRVLLR